MTTKFVISGLLVLLMITGNSQTVFTYGKNSVSKNEFLRAFNKNPSAAADRKKALKEYLDLYINFKLKVQGAKDARLNEDPTQQYELGNFKKQIAENVINDQAKLKDLTEEAFLRSQKDIHLAQVFIEVPAQGDTAEAFRKIEAAYKALKEGKDFAKVSEEFSTDPYTKQSGGDLEYITVFTLPYEFENRAYSLKPDTFSAPFKSKLGYHIFKNLGERKGLGRRKVAQILVAVPPRASEAEKAAAQRKADSVSNLIHNGATFEDLVKSVSNDVSSVNSSGQLAEFGIGEYSQVFEKAAFSLKSINEVSKPFETSYGYHILKLLDIKPVAETANSENALWIKDKLLRDDRLVQSKKLLLNKTLELVKYKPALYNQSELWSYTDSAIAGKQTKASKLNDKSLLFSFQKQNVTVADWIKYVKAIRSSPNQERGIIAYPQLMKDYVDVMAGEYYRTHLEDYSNEYRQQVQEFKEANLLFGIMDKNVWSKANTDTAGLQIYYNAHKQKYQWEASADALIVTCNNSSLAAEVQGKLKGNVANWRTITLGYDGQVVADSGRYELGQLPVVDRTNFRDELITAPVRNQNDSTYTFNYIVKVYNETAPRSFDDARGMVISDYQQVLEDNWLAELRKKYPVKINQAVFNSIR